MTKQITTREAREQLFDINSKQADDLRIKLFDVREQDKALPPEYRYEFEQIINKN